MAGPEPSCIKRWREQPRSLGTDQLVREGSVVSPETAIAPSLIHILAGKLGTARMLIKIWNVLRRIWWGAWQPTKAYPQNGRWWHYLDYWGTRSRDIIGALYIFVGPPWIGFFIYEHYSVNPKATVAAMAIPAVLWLVLVGLAYGAGRSRRT